MGNQGRIQEFGLGAKYGERGARAYTGVWGLCPQWGPRAKPLVGGLGGLGPPEADAIFAFWDCICELILTFDS